MGSFRYLAHHADSLGARRLDQYSSLSQVERMMVEYEEVIKQLGLSAKWHRVAVFCV